MNSRKEFCVNIGLGIRDFNLVNQSLLAKQCWRLLNNPTLLTARILLPKYCSKDNLLKVKPHSKSSWAWKSILHGRDLIAKYVCWRVGDGESINLFHDKWIPDLDKPLSHFIPYVGPDSLKVSYLLSVTPKGPSWDITKISDIIPSFLIPKILAITLPEGSVPDCYVWPFTNSGQYNSKSGYRCLYDMRRRNNASADSSAWIYKDYNVWNMVWNLDLPERIKVFIWKCLKGILPTKKNLATRTIGFSPSCPLCDVEEESIDHLFCSCPHSCSVWNAFDFQPPFHPTTTVLGFNEWLLDWIIHL